MRTKPTIPSDSDGRPDSRSLRRAREMPDAALGIEIVGGGSLGSVIADCCDRMGFFTRVIDPDTWELRNAANSFADPGQPKGDLVMRVQDALPAPCLIRVLATDNLTSRAHGALVRRSLPLAGFVDVRTGPNQVTVAMMPPKLTPEMIAAMGYMASEDSVPEMGCADRGSMPQTMMACAPASWAIMQMLRAYEAMCPWRPAYGKSDLILMDDGSYSRVDVRFNISRPAVTYNGLAFEQGEWESSGMNLFRGLSFDDANTILADHGRMVNRYGGEVVCRYGNRPMPVTTNCATVREKASRMVMEAEAVDYVDYSSENAIP